jgi:hypothetical protein
MISTRIAAVLTGLVLVAGCTHHDQTSSRSDHPAPATPAAARTSPDVTLPPVVGAQFRKDFPNGAITNITPTSTEAGAPIYRITYIENGRPGSATYFQNGERLPQPAPTDVAPGTPRAMPRESGGTTTPPPAPAR